MLLETGVRKELEGVKRLCQAGEGKGEAKGGVFASLFRLSAPFPRLSGPIPTASTIVSVQWEEDVLLEWPSSRAPRREGADRSLPRSLC